MRVLGIDPGYAIVGWGVLDYAGNRFAPVDFGAVCTDAGVLFEQRLVKILRFPEMSDEWLDFIAKCRAGETHPYDIVEGPMADDTIWDYVNGFTSGQISREAFWALAKFKHPTHQISFHTVNALHCLTFERSEPIHDRKAEK